MMVLESSIDHIHDLVREILQERRPVPHLQGYLALGSQAKALSAVHVV